MHKYIGLVCLCAIISCEVEPITNKEEPIKYGTIDFEVNVPQLSSTSKVPVCNNGQEGDGGETFIRMLARDENNIEWVIDARNGIWEEGSFFYNATTDPIPIGRYTVYEVSYINGGLIRYGIPDLLEAEILSQFNPVAVPFYMEIEEGTNNLSLTLFCFQEAEEVILSGPGNVDGFTFQWRNLSIYFSDEQRNCIDGVRVSFESSAGDVIGYSFEPKDYPINRDSPITVVPAIQASNMKIGIVADDILVEQRVYGVDGEELNWEAPLQFNYDCSIEIGDFLFGGIVYYILQPGDPGYDPNSIHGLVAAPSDQSNGIEWWNGEFISIPTEGGFYGAQNTQAIINAQGPGNYAASLCDGLELNGYSDWYLPSHSELGLMCSTIGGGAAPPNTNLGGFSASQFYWSSNALGLPVIEPIAVVLMDSCLDEEPEYFRQASASVRAVRSF